ncbi:MAG: hypothetical protein H0U21_00065 [Acidimicrobiia bacterium]|nr:hypothetical protein [Acidimicrobiia bacterium]
MSSPLRLLLTVLAGAGIATAIWCAAAAFSPPTSRPPRHRSSGRVRVDTRTVGLGLAAAMLVLVITRWPVAALAALVLVIGWPQLFQSVGATRERRRIDAMAKWLEDLRDLQRGSNLDLPQALDRSASRAPKEIAVELQRFGDRVRHHVTVDDALLGLADDLDHPVADNAVAAMLFAYGHASGSELYETFEQLAASARDELVARDRIDRMRQAFERSMRRMLAILAVLIAYLLVVSRDTLAEYETPTGQAYLVVPIAIWTGSLLWLRRLSRYDRTARFLDRDALVDRIGVGR